MHRSVFSVMDGNGALFGTLQGNTRDVLHKFTVDLPKKHGRGGQSALRFARLRMEKRHNYVRKVAETAVQLFISNDKPNISGMILAGSADFKTELSQSDMFDPRLQVRHSVVSHIFTPYQRPTSNEGHITLCYAIFYRLPPQPTDTHPDVS